MSPQSSAYKWLVSLYRRLLGRMRARLRLASLPAPQWVKAPNRIQIERLDPRFLTSVTPSGGEFLINQTTADTQQSPAIVVSGSGNTIAVWQSHNQDGEGWGIYGRRFDAAGNPLGGEFLVNQTTAKDQTDPSIAVDSAGEFVVSWTTKQAGKPDIYCRIFNANGTPATNEILVNTTTAGNEQDSAVAMAGGGDFVVTWEASGTQDTDVGIYCTYFKPGGAVRSAETLVNTTTVGVQNNPAVAMDANRDFVIAWTDKSTSKTKIKAQQFNVPGSAAAIARRGSEIAVGPAGTDAQDNPSVGIDGGANFVVTWADNLGGVNNTDILATRYSATGAAIDSAPVTVNTYTNDAQTLPVIAETPDGRYFIAWVSQNEDGDGRGIYGRAYAADGAPAGGESQINTTTQHEQTNPAVAWTGSTTAVAWDGNGTSDANGVFAKRLIVAITTPQNQPPTVAAPGTQTLAEDGSVVFSTATGNAFTVGDTDAGSGSEQVTLTATHGVLTLGSTAGLSFSAGSGSGDATVTFTGMLASLNAALAGLTFVPAANYNGSASLSIVINDQGNSGTGGALSASTTAPLTITPVNDAPVNAVPAGQTIAEDSTLIFAAANGNGISVSDVDAGSAAEQVTLSATHGALTLATRAGLTFSSGDGTSDATMTFTGTISAINTALNGLAYTPAADFNGAAALQIITNDQGNTGAGGALSSTSAIALTVTPVNDPPTITLPAGQVMTEDGFLALSTAAGNAVVIGDVDAGTGAVRLTLTASTGLLTLARTAGLTFSAGDGTADASMTCTGTVAAINAALDGLTFIPSADYNGAASVQFTVEDLGNNGAGGAKTATGALAVSVSAVDDAPVDTVPTTATTAEDTPLVFSPANGNAVSVADVDAGSNDEQVTLSVTHGTLTLASTAGLTFSTGDGTADTAMTMSGTLLEINAALNGLTFTPAVDFDGTAIVQITANDLGHTGAGGPLSAATSFAVSVTPVADTPSVTAATTAQNTQSTSGLVISRNSTDGTEVAYFKITNISGGTLYQHDGVTPIAAGSFITYTQANAGLRFTPTAGSTASGAFDVQASTAASDAGLGGGIATATITVGGAPVNLVPGPQATPEATPLVFSNARGNAISVSDPLLGTSLDTVTLTATHGTLTLATSAGLIFVTGTGAGDASMTFRGVLTSINAALDGLTFMPTAGFSGSASVQIETTDPNNIVLGPLTSSNGVAVTVTAVNDPPTVSVPAAQAALEDTPLVFSTGSSNAIVLSDPDAGAADVRVTLSASHGTLSLARTTGLTFVAGDGTADATVSFAGALANANAAIDGLIYTPDANFNGAAGVQISINDLGNTGSGGPRNAAAVVSVTVAAANDPPTLQVPAPQATAEDMPLVFSPGAGDGIVVADVDGGSAAEQLTLTTTDGTLTLGSTTGLTFSVGDGTSDATITFSGSLLDLNASLVGLTFTPTLDAYGSAAIHVAMDDLGHTGAGPAGSASGDVALAVTPIDDAPTLAAGGGSVVYTEGAAPVAAAPSLVCADIDSPTIAGATVTIAGYVAGEDVLGFVGQNSISGVWDANAGSLTLSGAASAAAYQAALRSVTYRNTSDDPHASARTIQFEVGDGQLVSGITARPVNVVAVNDAPTASGPSPQTTVFRVPLIFSTARGNALFVDDVDAGGLPVEVTLSAGSGTVTLSTTAGLAFTSGDGTADGSMQFRGTLAAVNSALDGLSYVPNSAYTGATQLQLAVDDLGHSGAGPAGSAGAIISVLVLPPPGVPGITISPPTPLFTSESGASATFTVVLDRQPTADVMIDLQTSNAGEGQSNISALVFSPSDWNVSQTVTVTGVNDVADDGPMPYSILTAPARSADAAYDGLDAADVSLVNRDDADAPQISTAGGDAGFVEGGSPVRVDEAVNVVDADDDLIGAAAVISGGYRRGQDALRFTPGHGITGQWDPAAGRLDLSGHASAADYQAALRSVTYLNSSSDPDATDRAVAFTLVADDAISPAATRRVRVTALNTPPVTTVPGPQVTDEGVPLIFSDANGNPISIADADARGAFIQVILKARRGSVTLAHTDGLRFALGTGTNDLIVQFTGTLPAVNNALRGLSFSASSSPARSSAGLLVVVNDLGNTGEGGPKLVNRFVPVSTHPKQPAPPAAEIAPAPTSAAPTSPAAPIVEKQSASLVTPTGGDAPLASHEAAPPIATAPSASEAVASVAPAAVAGNAAPATPVATPQTPAPAAPPVAPGKAAPVRSEAAVKTTRPPGPIVVSGARPGPGGMTVTPVQGGSTDPAQVSPVLAEQSPMWNALNELHKEMTSDREVRVVAGTAAFVTVGTSVLYFIWAVRAGSMLSSLMSAIPAWNAVDPLPILDQMANRDRNEDDEGLDTLVEGHSLQL